MLEYVAFLTGIVFVLLTLYRSDTYRQFFSSKSFVTGASFMICSGGVIVLHYILFRAETNIMSMRGMLLIVVGVTIAVIILLIFIVIGATSIGARKKKDDNKSVIATENTLDLDITEYAKDIKKLAENANAEFEKTINEVETIFAHIFEIIPDDMPKISVRPDVPDITTATACFTFKRNNPRVIYESLSNSSKTISGSTFKTKVPLRAAAKLYVSHSASMKDEMIDYIKFCIEEEVKNFYGRGK
jgi:type II secretory pathway pseudopilin PulG